MARKLDQTTADIPSNIDTVRKRLVGAALPYAASLHDRPGLVGIMLYGSLVRGSLTPFSDIDMALFYEGAPPHRFEFRFTGGEKVDLIAFPIEQATKLLDPLPRSLDAGFPFSYVLESLLLARDESILFDPTGELRRVKARLGEAVSFDALNRASLSDGYHRFYQPGIEAARSLLEQGDAAGALDRANWSGGALTILLQDATRMKDVREAAERLEIPEFAALRDELAAVMAPSDDAIEAVWSATTSLWDYTLQTAEGAVRERLRALDTAEPDRFELIGNYDLFWPGDILYEFGRLMKEVTFALRWSRYDLDRGLGEAGLRHLWSCRDAQGVRHRWEALAAALKGSGHDCSSVIEPMLASPEFARLGEILDAARKRLDRTGVTAEAARQAVDLVEVMERTLARVIPLMTADELAEWNGQPRSCR